MIKLLKLFVVVMLFYTTAFGGNADRQGEAGASELLINPWARSSGWDGINTACVQGIEAINMNVAGMAFTRKTELVFSHVEWLSGTGIAFNTFGFSQSLGKNGGVIGADIMSIDFGDIQITTTDLPEGGLGTYKPQYLNFALAYAKVFSNSIYGGFVVRGISESLSSVSAFGVGLDAGIQYVTGPKKDPTAVKFGIALRNVGTQMKFGGDGLSFRGAAPESNYTMTVEQRSQSYQLPSLLNIGLSYDFKFGSQAKKDHRLTVAGNFTSHSFSQDQFGAGVEYAFKELVMIRCGYNYQSGLTDPSTRVTALTGFSAGASFDVPVKKGGPKIGLDYSYRTSDPFAGTNSVGVRIVL